MDESNKQIRANAMALSVLINRYKEEYRELFEHFMHSDSLSETVKKEKT